MAQASTMDSAGSFRPALIRVLKFPEDLLKIQPGDDEFVFDGRCWGRGLGYCQHGSENREKRYLTIILG
jgi:hypothetical protein